MGTNRRARGALAVFACCAVSACTPGRDNPDDPSNRPTAVLVVRTVAGGFAEGNRQTTFVLDASASSDPNGRTLTFAFDVDDDPDGFERVSPTPCGNGRVACLETTLAAPPELATIGGKGAARRTVRVRVSAQGGGTAITAADVVIYNRAPALPDELDLFTPERTGGIAMLDPCAGSCNSLDPDGDPLSWQWTQLRGENAGLADANLPVARATTVPFGEQTLLFGLAVGDGLATKNVLVRLHVTTLIWLSAIPPSTRAYRFYPDFRPVYFEETPAAGLMPFAAAGALMSDGEEVLAGYGVMTDPGQAWERGRVDRLAVGTTSDLALVDRWDALGVVTPSSIAKDGSPCVAFRGFTKFYGFETNGPDSSFFARLAPGGVIVRGSDWALGEDPTHVLAGPDETNDCWAITTVLPDDGIITTTGTAHVFRLDESGIASPISPAYEQITAVTRTGDGALWIAAKDGACAGSVLVRRTSFSSAPESLVCFDTAVDGLAPHPDSGVFAHDADSLAILHVTTAGTFTVTSAPAIVLPEARLDIGMSAATPNMATDVLERRLWMVDGPVGQLVRLTERNRDLVDPRYVSGLALSTPGYYPRFHAVAGPHRGRMLASNGDGFAANGQVVAAIPSHLRRLEELFLSSERIRFGAIPGTGDAWATLGDAGASTLRRIDSEGAVKQSAAIASSTDVSAEADGRPWVASGGSAPALRLLDASGSVVRDVLISAGMPHAIASRGTACAVVREDFGVSGIARVTATGPLEYAGGKPWFESKVVTTSIRPDGSCWYAFDGSGHVVHWTGSGAPVVQALAKSRLASTDPLTGDAWLTSDGELFTLSPGGTPVRRTTAGVDFFDLATVRRLCPEQGACTTNNAPLRMWAVGAGGARLYRLDRNGIVDRSFSLPDNFTFPSDLEVSP